MIYISKGRMYACWHADFREMKGQHSSLYSVQVFRLQLYATSCHSTNSLKDMEVPYWFYEGEDQGFCWGYSCHGLASCRAQPHAQAMWRKKKLTVYWCGRGGILREERRKMMSRDALAPPVIAVASLKEWRREVGIRQCFQRAGDDSKDVTIA